MALLGKKAVIRYIANAGLLIEYKNKKVMIDAVHVDKVNPYISVPDKILEKTVMGKEPYDNIDIFMFTHNHAEHFDAFAVCEILKRNRFTQVVGPKAVTEAIKASPNYNDEILLQLKTINLDVGKSITMVLKDIPFEIIALRHDGKNYADVENLAFFFEMGGRTFLHVGDAMPDYEEFKQYDIFERIIDVLIVPFPYMGLSMGRKIIRAVDPKQTVIVHLPDKKLDTQNWISATHKAYKKYEKEMPLTYFCTTPGEEIQVK